MPRAQIKYDEYKVKAFLDATLSLKAARCRSCLGRRLTQTGRSLRSLTPTAIKEIDSKKHDGRIGRVARAFNRLFSSVATGGPPIVLRETRPRVELAMAGAARIPWDQHDDLDLADGDSCIVAEVLYARDMAASGKLIVSQDTKPLALASNYAVATLHVSDNWLRQSEPGPADRENQRLRQRLARYEATELAFDISIELIGEEPVSIVHIEDLSDAERTAIQRKIRELNPPVNQVRGTYGLMSGLGNFDTSYDDRFKANRKRISAFLASYAQELERLLRPCRHLQPLQRPASPDLSRTPKAFSRCGDGVMATRRNANVSTLICNSCSRLSINVTMPAGMLVIRMTTRAPRSVKMRVSTITDN